MLTKKTRYALKALTILAGRAGREPVLIGELSERGGIPRKFLEAILRELKNRGILTAQRGRGGGYMLCQKPEDITLAEIIRALDGPIAPVPCLSRTAYRKCDDCKSEQACGLRLVLKDLHEAMLIILERTTLIDLVQKTREASEEVSRTFSYSI